MTVSPHIDMDQLFTTQPNPTHQLLYPNKPYPTHFYQSYFDLTKLVAVGISNASVSKGYDRTHHYIPLEYTIKKIM